MRTTQKLLFLVLGALVFGPVPGQARPKPTPLAELLHPPRHRLPPQTVPHRLEVDRGGLFALGGFEVVTRPDGLTHSPRMKLVAREPHGFRLGEGTLLYETDGPDRMRAVGVGKVVEVHPLGKGVDRVVLRISCRYLQMGYRYLGVRGPRGAPEPVWQAGKDPAGHRYFTHPRNVTGIDSWIYARLTAGKIWKTMPEVLVRCAMGAPAQVERRRTPSGVRERWWYPRSDRHSTWIFMDGGELREWYDDWDEDSRGQDLRRPMPLMARGAF